MSSIEIAAIPSIFFAGIIGCYVPFLTRQLESGLQQAILTRGNAFAAGVLTAGGLVHLLPDAAEDITFTDFPFAGAFAGSIFIVMLLIEVLSHGRSTNKIEYNEMQHPGVANIPPTITDPLVQDLQSRGHTIQIFMLALGLISHSVVAGLALSLSGRISTQIGILIAILAHKSFAAFALGSSCITQEWSVKRATPLLIVFCISTPIGIGVGMAIDEAITEDSQAVPILQSGAAGVFLYMGCWHLLQDVIKKRSIFDFISYALGYAGMTTLAIWT